MLSSSQGVNTEGDELDSEDDEDMGIHDIFSLYSLTN